jgi:hypothetical protein
MLLIVHSVALRCLRRLSQEPLNFLQRKDWAAQGA